MDHIMEWTYLCKCGGGIKDPDRTATTCPHKNCKLTIEHPTAATATPKTWNLNLTKKANEAQERLDKVGTDGVLPLSQEQQEAHDRTQLLQDEISKLEAMGDEAKPLIGIKLKEIKDLKKKLPVQASQ